MYENLTRLTMQIFKNSKIANSLFENNDKRGNE